MNPVEGLDPSAVTAIASVGLSVALTVAVIQAWYRTRIGRVSTKLDAPPITDRVAELARQLNEAVKLVEVLMGELSTVARERAADVVALETTISDLKQRQLEKEEEIAVWRASRSRSPRCSAASWPTWSAGRPSLGATT